MKKNGKAFLSAVLTGVMAVSLLAGCAGDGGKNEDAGNGEGNKTAGDSKNQQGTSQTGSEKKDKITVSIYDRGNISPEEGVIENNRWTKWINENAPVEVEFIAVPRWTSGQKYSTLLASNSAPDLILEYDMNILGSMITNGSLMPIGGVIDQYSTEYKALVEKYPIIKKMGTVNGEFYYFSRVEKIYPNHTLTVRKDWLDKLGLAVPKTTDEFYKMAEAFAKQDPDGNGADDTYGMALSFVSGQQIDFMFGAGNTGNFAVNGDKFEYAWDRKMAATQFKKDMYDNGIVNRDFAVDTSGEQGIQDFITGKLGAIGLNNGALITSIGTLENFYENNPGAELIEIPLPESEFGSFSTAVAGGCAVVGAINSSCKNPEAVMKYMDWLNSSPDVYNTLAFGGEAYAELTENGVWAARDKEVSAKEVYGTDFFMPVSTIEFAIGQDKMFDQNTEIGQKMLELYSQAVEAYVMPDKRPANFTDALPRPSLSTELTLINTNTYGSSVMGDNWSKAIISGSDYTVEQACQDNRKLVEEGQGEKIAEYYQSWYDQAMKDGILITLDEINALK